MKVHFSRSDSGETKVQLVEKGNVRPFNYITLVKYLIDNGTLEETTFDGGFSVEEEDVVNSMVQLLEQSCNKKSKTV